VPIFYECQRCTACCRWPGQVRLSDAEITRLAAFKGMSEPDFIQQFTRLRWDRGGLALPEKPNGECIFLDGENCAVQSVKPQQCRDFPNLWMNSLWGKFPLEYIKKEYPMLVNCAGFKAFLKSEENNKKSDQNPETKDQQAGQILKLPETCSDDPAASKPLFQPQ